MEHISLSAELGGIHYAIEVAYWIADSVAMGAVPDPERTHSAPVIISAILLLVETKLHQLGCVLRGEENPAHLLTPHNVTAGQYAVGCTRDACLPAAGEAYKVRESH